jgi:hypothetical protein
LRAFLAHDPGRQERILAWLKTPLKDAAAMNATRQAAYRALMSLEVPVSTWSGGRTHWNRSRLGVVKSHALDALCVGDVAGVRNIRQPVLAIRARGRGQRCRTTVDAFGFPRGYRMRSRRAYGFQTGDQVRAVVTGGRCVGVHVGRVAVRASGCFRIGSVDGISWRHCKILQRGDGYEYGKGVLAVLAPA